MEKIKELRVGGCKELFIGIESGSESVRKRINKMGDSNDIIKVSQEILQNGIDLKGYFIYGFPKETREDFQKTFELAKELNCDSKTVIQKLYQDKSKVVYQQDGVVVVNGGTSTILMAAIGFIGAFVVAAVAVYFIGRHKDNRLTVAAAEPVSELKLEAAVSEEKDEK